MAFRMRASKVRHVFGKAHKRDRCYDGISVTRNAHDADFCAVNTKFLAVVIEAVGGGAFIVHRLDKPGRLDLNASRVVGHKGAVLDIKWNPFDENVIASASEDCTVKVWEIPEDGLTENLTKEVVNLVGHNRRVGFLEWHPTAEHVLATAGYDYMIMIWDISTGEELVSIDSHPDMIFSMSFDPLGIRMVTTCKDKKIRVIDPRISEVVAVGEGHAGTKASHVVFLGDSGRIFSTGFSRGNERQYAVWDAKDLSKPLMMDNIDSSSGVLHPYYDDDRKVVYVAGKGDGNIRYYEVVKERPYCYYLEVYKSSDAQRGLGILPMRALNTKECEVMRMYKLHSKNLCEIVSFYIPRKSDLFQDDLYPDTYAGEPTISAEDWLAGTMPTLKKVSMKPTGSGPSTPQRRSTDRDVEEKPVEKREPKRDTRQEERKEAKPKHEERRHKQEEKHEERHEEPAEKPVIRTAEKAVSKKAEKDYKKLYYEAREENLRLKDEIGEIDSLRREIDDLKAQIKSKDIKIRQLVMEVEDLST
ncbi:coronin-1A-like isoform X2 [Corticium candelabrum]|uniref:coronin-1A-like isoform X2 n=1 Tax=Corticium candelabrum TaxID=121492 RepID=UPI002E25413C|nr:coronin-1A-like isoform X2 [Corticium candelabrum]